MKKFFLTIILFMLSLPALAFVKGFNQAWMKNHYAYQWLNRYYDARHVEHLMGLNQQIQSEMLRIWLYEGKSLAQFTFENDKLQLKPEILKNIRHFLTVARSHNIKVSLTFLDGNAFKNLKLYPDRLNFWWNVFNNQHGKQEEFYKKAILPIYQLASEFPETVTQIDLVNEVNAIDYYQLFQHGKQTMSQFLCNLKKASPVPITASLGWGDAEARFFSGFLSESCLDFYDIHYYNDSGEIPGCNKLKKLAQKGVWLQLGEFGQLSHSFDDELQSQVTHNFLTNARKCGFRGALAWRLEDYRQGHNPEARYSYMAYGKPRPALEFFSQFK
jgi:hypothetical protein